ncbi:hypothetical protein AQUCO_05800200v1 [Aquilegia coerulea]|uniref:Uncharacterized protein n=1 Tax=Aquilegia coerulea TaxID=218851 RepID=A0A2G5CF90_AQUCA|nr:hypothetical protein AQUCO_05800200v1 [Aquilegia coerulea]
MRITVIEETIVKPIEETPHESLWTPNTDQLFNCLVPSVYFYKPNKTSDFFSCNVLKYALSKVLVPFYPIAGRLKRNKEGRVEIDCNGEGTLFVEAETDSVLDDLGDFVPTEEVRQLLPYRMYNPKDISSFPLFSVQVTYFKCGGASVGVLVEHSMVDGTSGTYFTNSWARIARGLDIKILPFVDRTLLRSRDPPTPSFRHVEFESSPAMLSQGRNPFCVAMFKLSCNQINLLKAQSTDDESGSVRFSSFEVIASHVWRCVGKARGVHDDEELKIQIAIDGRSRLRPQLPSEYFGNAIFNVKPMATAGELVSKPLIDIVRKMHDVLVRADDEYLKSALDFLEIQPDLLRVLPPLRCPDMAFTTWCSMPIYEADFGWGRPTFVGLGNILVEGLAYLLPSPIIDGSRLLVISLKPDHMVLFKKYVYDI